MVNLGTPFSVKNRLSIFDMSPHLQGLLSRSQVVVDQVYSAACNMRVRHVTIIEFFMATAVKRVPDLNRPTSLTIWMKS